MLQSIAHLFQRTSVPSVSLINTSKVAFFQKATVSTTPLFDAFLEGFQKEYAANPQIQSQETMVQKNRMIEEYLNSLNTPSIPLTKEETDAFWQRVEEVVPRSGTPFAR